MADRALAGITFGTLLDAVAAKTPTPGGGAVASAVGALASALAGMVVSYSVGKKSLAAHEPLLKEADAELARARVILLRLADEDAAAYGLVNELQRLPETDSRRRDQLPAALDASVQPPLATIATSVALLRLFEKLATTTNRQLRSDLAIAAVHNLIAFGAIFILMMLMFRVSPGADGVLPHGAALTPHLLLVPLGLVMLYVFTLGVTLIAMTLTTYFRDMEHIISVGMQALYFATPIFFRTQDVPKLKPFIEANPLTWILAFFQDGIYHHQWPDLRYWIVAPASALIVFGFGYVVYKKHEYEYIFRL